MLSDRATETVERALGLARARRHSEATVEHLLLALIEDANAGALLKACGAGLERLRADLTAYLDHELPGSPSSDSAAQVRQGEGFERALQRAAIHVQSDPKAGEAGKATGANLLLGLLSERESKAAQIIKDHGISRMKVISTFNFPPE